MPICGGSAPNAWSVGARITQAASFRPSLPWSTGISSRSLHAGSSNGVPRPRVGRSLSRRGEHSGFVLRRSRRATAGVRSAPGAGGGAGGHEGRASQDTLPAMTAAQPVARHGGQGVAAAQRAQTLGSCRSTPLNRHTPPSLILALDYAQKLSPSINVELVVGLEVFRHYADRIAAHPPLAAH